MSRENRLLKSCIHLENSNKHLKSPCIDLLAVLMLVVTLILLNDNFVSFVGLLLVLPSKVINNF